MMKFFKMTNAPGAKRSANKLDKSKDGRKKLSVEVVAPKNVDQSYVDYFVRTLLEQHFIPGS